MPDMTERIESFQAQPETSMQCLIEGMSKLESKREAPRLELRKHKPKPSEVVGYLLLLFGAVAFTSSIVYASSILAFIGLGLAFWGALLMFVKHEKYVKARLLDSTALSSLMTIDRIITHFDCKGKAIYLPPRYLTRLKGGTIFIPSRRRTIIPHIKEIAEEKLFLEDSQGICLTPPGLGLANLYENELGKDFVKVNLNYLKNNLPKIFVEDLEIAEDLEISIEGDVIQVEITNSIYKNFCKKARKLFNICDSLGCPLCGSIAVALARASGKPIIIKKTDLSKDNKTIKVYYQMIEE